MNAKPKIKIVFFAYHSTSLLRQYWNYLKDKADCHWLTFSSAVYDELKEGGYQNVYFKNILGDETKSVITAKIIRWMKSLFPKYFYHGLIKKTLDDLDADIIISNVTLPLIGYTSRAMKTLVFHSVCYKKYILIPQTLQFDLVLLPGQSYKDTMCQRYEVRNPDKLKIVGWPRIDDFVNNKYTMEDRNKFMTKLRLNPARKNVLYAPTWNSFYQRGIFPKSFGKVADAFGEFCKRLKEFDINLIVRLHSISAKLAGDARLQRIAKKYDVCFFRKLRSEYFDNLTEHFLWSTDVLISDVSGIITDYMILNRPIVYLEPDAEDFDWKESDLPKEFRAGAVASSMEQLVEGVRCALDAPNEYERKRKEIAQKIFYKMDGRSTQRASEAVLNYYLENMASRPGELVKSV